MSQRFGRRHAVVVITSGVAVFAALAIPILRRLTAPRRASAHRASAPDPSPIDPSLLARVADFQGALFGLRVIERDRDALADVLAEIIRSDGGWREEFRAAADYVDRLARDRGFASFADASDDARDAIVDTIMRPSSETRGSALKAVVSLNERTRRRMRGSMIERLSIAYRSSSVAWRRRGYARAPGEPGDPDEYTRPGSVLAC